MNIEDQETTEIETGTGETDAGQVQEVSTDAESDGKPAPTPEQASEDTPPSKVEEAPTETSSQKRRRERREQTERLNREVQTQRDQLKAIKDAASGIKQPVEADFEDLDAYNAALSLYAARRANNEDKAEQAERSVKQAEEQRKQSAMESWRETEADSRKKYDDFDAVAYGQFPVSAIMADMIQESEIGGDLLYHLGSNTEVSEKISRMQPAQAIKEMTRLEMKLEGEMNRKALETPSDPPKSNAPPPINPVNGGSGPVQKDPEQMGMAEYIKWRQSSGTSQSS